MEIRKAEKRDISGIMRLLRQVNDIHALSRPDIFIKGHTKYNNEGLLEIIHDPESPVFVSIAEDGGISGYCFCIIEDPSKHANLQPIKTLYIDDLCVDEDKRGQHIGKKLFEFVKEYAKKHGFYNVTLNVWRDNSGAQKFYEAMGMTTMKTTLECLLRDACCVLRDA